MHPASPEVMLLDEAHANKFDRVVIADDAVDVDLELDWASSTRFTCLVLTTNGL